jgi:hypothetical protein
MHLMERGGEKVMTRNPSIEERARQMIIYKITGRGDVPNSLAYDFTQVMNYLTDHKYWRKIGGTEEKPVFELTPEGKTWALKGMKR